LENKFQKSELERKMVAEKMKIASHFYNSNLSTLNKTMNDLKQRNIILKEENDQLRVRIRYSEVPSGNSVEEQWKLLRNKESELEKLCTEMRQVISTVGNSGILTNGKKLDIALNSSESYEDSDSDDYVSSDDEGEELSLEKPRNTNKMEEKADVNT